MSDLATQDPSPSDRYAPRKLAGAGAPALQQQDQGRMSGAAPGMAGVRVFAVGEYLVGDAEDTLLNGHPDIRY